MPPCQMTERYLMVVSGEESNSLSLSDRTNERNGGMEMERLLPFQRGGIKWQRLNRIVYSLNLLHKSVNTCISGPFKSKGSPPPASEEWWCPLMFIPVSFPVCLFHCDFSR